MNVFVINYSANPPSFSRASWRIFCSDYFLFGNPSFHEAVCPGSRWPGWWPMGVEYFIRANNDLGRILDTWGLREDFTWFYKKTPWLREDFGPARTEGEIYARTPREGSVPPPRDFRRKTAEFGRIFELGGIFKRKLRSWEGFLNWEGLSKED